MLPQVAKSEMGQPYITHITLDEYAAWYEDFAVITRDEQGICEIRLHTDGGPAVMGEGMHMAVPAIIKYVGMDPENEVVIITGTGDALFGAIDPAAVAAIAQWVAAQPLKIAEHLFKMLPEALGIGTNILFDVHVPTIGVINGPTLAGQNHLFTYCDLTLAADDATFFDNHYQRNLVPGDGLFQALQHFAGDKEANRLIFTGEAVPADKALAMGMVSEVLPREKLMARAYEYARDIMKADRYVRMLTHAAMRQTALRRVTEDLQAHLSLEGWSGALSMIRMATQNVVEKPAML
jgi:enoyl-CoA hydratase/carnithine racemase